MLPSPVGVPGAVDRAASGFVTPSPILLAMAWCSRATRERAGGWKVAADARSARRQVDADLSVRDEVRRYAVLQEQVSGGRRGRNGL